MRSKAPTSLIVKIILGAVVLIAAIGTTLFLSMPKTFSCKENGQSAVLSNNVLTFSCTSPRFIVSCDERTLAFSSGVFTCSSFDGTKYKFIGSYAQVVPN